MSEATGPLMYLQLRPVYSLLSNTLLSRAADCQIDLQSLVANPMMMLKFGPVHSLIDLMSMDTKLQRPAF